ncbi:putative type IX secretion system sortase PorU2 [Runella limosa]|uniref:putative type IX secretion system sortase PorU2 n=1 Tax=Runella limosa TaxID=370978 RepID=UPI00041439A6|nr:C25 family cysteine peptidase [Runella limosa]
MKLRFEVEAIIATFFFFILALSTNAQRYGNEWINFQQTYFKIPVAQKGLYRISANELRQAGVPVSTLNPTSIQLFFRGKEQAIFIQGETDNRLDESDYLEFYGEGNDGTQDSLLYLPHSAQPHKLYNLYSDTTAYFLTWRLDGQAGKRMGFYQENPTPTLTPEPYHREDLLVSNIASYNYTGMSEGLMYPLGSPSGAQNSFYDYGEGWTGPEISINKRNQRRFTLENPVRTGFQPQLELHLMGRDHRAHFIEISVGSAVNANRLVDTVRFSYQNALLVQYPISFSDVSLDSNRISIATISRGGFPNQAEDVYSVTYYRLRYPQRFDVLNNPQKYFYLLPNSQNKSYLEIANATAATRLFDISDKNNVGRVGSTLENSTLKAVVRETASGKTLFATRLPLAVPSIQRVSFRNIDPTKANYLVVTHRNLINVAKQFGGYRASVAGGKYDTLTVQMDLLVNQFNYGEFSPLAVRRFVQFMVEKGSPKFLFIVGRTQQIDFNRTNSNLANVDMVPTFGWPGSDNLFSHGLKGQPSLVPALPTGRIWTDNPQEVLNYLEKVKEHEATPMNALWRKNILHLSGGTNSFEQGQFLGIMESFRKKAQKEFLGAKVTTITKKTDEAIEYVGITNEVNEGAGIMTLFGHSALNVTDIDLGMVSNDVFGYRNKGRYPLVFANGCVVGNFTFGYSRTYAQDWITTKDRGAILFLAHSNVAYVYSLNDYANTFYNVMLGDSTNFNRPFGEIYQQIIRKTLALYPEDPTYQADAQQMTLQGDPAVVIFPTQKPDYSVNSQSILVQSKNGAAVSAFSDSLKIKVVVANLGLYRNEKLPIRLTRTTRDGAVSVYDATFSAVAYLDTLTFSLSHDRSQSGLNRFEVQIDPNGVLAENSRTNNLASVELSLPVAGAYPLLPAEYSVVSTTENGTPTTLLVAQQIDNSNRNYTVEIDTTTRFDSPFKRTQAIAATVLPTWKVTLLNRDSTTYYWRIRYADRPASSDNVWTESSFTFVKNGGEGWAQRQPSQFTKATPLEVNLSVNTQPTWSYKTVSTNVKAVVAGSSVGAFNEGYKVSQLSINDILLVVEGNCTTFDQIDNWRPGANLAVTALHRDNLQAYSVMPSRNCGNPPYVMNTLRQREIVNDKLFSKWVDAVPDGDWIVLMTLNGIQFDLWPASELNKLTELGLTQASMARLQSPYLLIVQKGAKQPAVEVVADPNDLAPSLRTLTLDNFTVKSNSGKGQITSSLVGPASQWKTLNYKTEPLTSNQTQATLEVIGISLNGTEKVLKTGLAMGTVSLQDVDVNTYPYLRLRLQLANKDARVSTPLQLRNWWINYTPVPEGSATASLNGALERQEGEVVSVNVSFKNISPVAFRDSLVVQQTIFSPTGAPQMSERKLGRLQPNEEATFTISMPTLGKGGDNRLLVNINPRQQPEQNYDNNTINLPFTVIPDRFAPTLDVFFDGQRIRDGEVVSATPTILFQLKDENRFLFKRDTLGMDLFLQRPSQTTFQRIAFSNSVIRFVPADNQNVARIEFRPATLPDGMYTLRFQGADATLNRTGVYQISFRVINEQKLVSVEATPNPASDLIRVSFTVSGKENPNEATITLVDMTGRTFKTASFVPRVGFNEWIWTNTTDLPAGTYVYRVTVKKNGEDIPVADGVKTTGKIVVIR